MVELAKRNSVKVKLTNNPTIADIYDRKDNAFDLLRFVFAVMVIYCHCYATLKGPNREDLLGIWTGSQIDCGSLAVDCFFIISGFLIAQSMLNSKSYKAYLIKRILRVIPAFLVSLFLISFVLGPIVTNMNLSRYFQDDGCTGPFSFIFKNVTFNIFGYSWTVHDVFSHNPFPSSANGSMWTLKHEFACYLVILLLSCFRCFKHRSLTLFVWACSAALLVLNYKYNFCLTPFTGDKGWIFSGYEYPSFVRLCFFFLAGTNIYIFKDKIRFDYRWILLAIVIILLSEKLNLLRYSMMICLPYIIIAVGTKFKLSFLRKYGDFSYGMYIYAFPVQQFVVYLLKSRLNILTHFLLSSIITLGVSFLSWKFIENPALQLKKKL